MIDANSLRRGNWLNYTGESAGSYPVGHIQVSEILEDGINLSQGDMVIYEAELLEGIPLTPEVLKACGLVYPESDWEDYYFHPDTEIDFTIEPTGDGYAFSGSEFTHGRTFHFLHELQNLFFAMQGRELEVNLPTIVAEGALKPLVRHEYEGNALNASDFADPSKWKVSNDSMKDDNGGAIDNKPSSPE